MLLVVTYSREARQSLRNICRSHEESIVRRFGRAALFEPTEFGAFLAMRLRAKHDLAVQVERTRPFNEYDSVRESVREAAASYEARTERATPYARFSAGRDIPSQDSMKDTDL